MSSDLLFAPNSYVVEYKFELLLANMGLRSEKPFKIVKKEYYIVSTLTLFGRSGQ